MSLHISECESRSVKNMQPYCMGKSIILSHVRYINQGGSNSLMFHSPVTEVNGQFHTSGCNRLDVSGLCLGHKMTRKEFLDRYCDGVEPGTKTK